MRNKNPNDALFRLIKSMGQGEKRFFNLYCNRYASSKGKIYLKLFRAIDKQVEYDEDVFKKEFNSGSRRFHLVKNYLYNLLIEALVKYYSTTGNSSLNDKLIEADVLDEKRLYDLYEILLYKIRVAAVEREDFLIAVETIRREKILQINKSGYYDIDALKRMRELEDHYIELYKEVETYRELCNEINSYSRRYTTITNEIYTRFSKMPLFKDDSLPSSNHARFLYYQLRGTYYLTLGDFKQSTKEFRGSVRMFDANPVFKQHNPRIVVTAAHNYINNCIMLGEYNEALESIKKVKAFITQFPELMKRRILGFYIQELIIYKDTGKKEKAIKLITEVGDEIEKKTISIMNEFDRYLFYVNAAFVFLEFGDYKMCLRWANKVLNPEAEKVSVKYFYNARILQLISLYELEDYEFLEYRVKSFYRFMIKRGALGKIEMVLLEFFRKILKGTYLHERKKLRELFIQLKQSIEKALEDSTNTGLLISYPDFSGWLQNRAKRI
jgi:hypothetical protein